MAEYTIQLINVEALKKGALADYRKLLDPDYWLYLKSRRNPNLIFLGVTQDKVPVGVLLAEALQYYTLDVSKPFSVGTIHQIKMNDFNDIVCRELLNIVENNLKERNCNMVDCILPSNSSFIKFLRERGWEGPKPQILHYEFDTYNFHPDWFNKVHNIPLNEEYSIIKWKNMTQTEWDLLINRQKNQLIPEDVNPFNPSFGSFESTNSLALRHQHEVIGWILTHKINKNTLRYSSFYIQPEYRLLGLATKLLVEAISQQQLSPFQYATLDINLAQSEKNWISFIDKYLAPQALSFSQNDQYWLKLKSPVDEDAPLDAT